MNIRPTPMVTDTMGTQITLAMDMISLETSDIRWCITETHTETEVTMGKHWWDNPETSYYDLYGEPFNGNGYGGSENEGGEVDGFGGETQGSDCWYFGDGIGGGHGR